MSNPSDLPGQRGPLIDVDDLRDAGVEVSDDVDYPEVPEGTFVLDDEDAGECRWADDGELAPMYIDNVDLVEGIQHDVWTLTIDDSDEFVFRTRSGSEATVSWGDIDISDGPRAERFLLHNGVVWPTDEHQNVQLNGSNTPRLAALKEWMLEELATRSEQRLEIAEIVYAFTQILRKNTSPLSHM